MDERPVSGMAEGRVAVAQLDGDHPRPSHGPIHARQRSLLGLSVVKRGRIRGENHIRLYVSSTMWNGPIPAVTGCSPAGADENLLVVLDGRRGNVAFGFQAIAAADHFLVPPGPLSGN